jgi:hypothetical protein
MIVLDPAPSVAEEVLITSDAPAKHHEGQEDMADQWKGKGKAPTPSDIDPGTTSDTLAVDWTEYEPPEGLNYTGDIKSDTVLQLIQKSIDNIKARILEEEEKRKLAAEAVRQRQEEAASQEREKAKRPENVGGPLDQESGQVDRPDRPVSLKQDISTVDDTSGFLTDLLRWPMKRTLMHLFQKWNSGPERGESSSAGAVRQRLLMSPSQVELATYSARKRFVIDLIKKATGEDSSTSPASSLREAEV